jgi:hypothetical protein
VIFFSLKNGLVGTESRTTVNDDENNLYDEDARQEQEDAIRESRFPSPLPTAGDHVFRKTNDEERVWVENTLGREPLYMDGYKWAADVLFNHVEEVRADRDDQSLDITNWLIYPIYFLYRHAIELSLKQIRDTQPHRSGVSTDEYHHDLRKLWVEVRDWVQSVGGKRLSDEAQAFESLIDEIHKADPKGDAGRYRAHRNRRETFESLRPIDLPNLRETLNKMLNFLTWIRSLYEDQVQQDQLDDSNREWEENQ